MTDICERLHAKRSCTVCEGDGVKYTGKVCGGCNGAGEVLRYDGVGVEAAREISTLRRRVEELEGLIQRNWKGRCWRPINDEDAEEVRRALSSGRDEG